MLEQLKKLSTTQKLIGVVVLVLVVYLLYTHYENLDGNPVTLSNSNLATITNNPDNKLDKSTNAFFTLFASAGPKHFTTACISSAIPSLG